MPAGLPLVCTGGEYFLLLYYITIPQLLNSILIFHKAGGKNPCESYIVNVSSWIPLDNVREFDI